MRLDGPLLSSSAGRPRTCPARRAAQASIFKYALARSASRFARAACPPHAPIPRHFPRPSPVPSQPQPPLCPRLALRIKPAAAAQITP